MSFYILIQSVYNEMNVLLYALFSLSIDDYGILW